MKTIWVFRPGALGDTILCLPFLIELNKREANANIIFYGTSVYSAILKHFLPNIKYLDFQTRDLLPLFNCDFQVSDMQIVKPDQIYSFLKHDALIKKNIYTLCNESFFYEINESCGLSVDQQMLSVFQKTDDTIPYSFIKPVLQNKKLLVHCGSGTVKKLLPISFWSALLSQAKKYFEIQVLVGPADTELIRSFQGQYTIVQNQSIDQLVNNLPNYGKYLGLDSGVSHLAGAMGLSGIAFFHASNPLYWRPMGFIEPVWSKKTDINEVISILLK